MHEASPYDFWRESESDSLSGRLVETFCLAVFPEDGQQLFGVAIEDAVDGALAGDIFDLAAAESVCCSQGAGLYLGEFG